VLDVNLPYFWSQGRLVFTGCFVPSGLLARHLILRSSTGTSLRSRIVINVTMGVASWIVVVGFPVAVAVQVLAHNLFLDRIPTGNAAPYSWILALLLSVAIAVAAELSAARMFFKLKLAGRTRILLWAGDACCVALAAYATATYVLAHPAIA